MGDKKLYCPICGQPTRVYMGNSRKDLLCGTHADALKAGGISLNENGLFVDIKTGEILSKNYEESKKVEVITETIVKCIACGKETKTGFLFCGACYKKYNEKKLLVEITKCKVLKQYN